VSADRVHHHGGLRAALIGASFDLLAEGGLRRLSAVAVVRRLGASSVAPYRRFAGRAHLLSAVSAAAAHGYASLFTDGFFARNAGTVDDIATRAVQATGTLIGPPPARSPPAGRQVGAPPLPRRGRSQRAGASREYFFVVRLSIETALSCADRLGPSSPAVRKALAGWSEDLDAAGPGDGPPEAAVLRARLGRRQVAEPVCGRCRPVGGARVRCVVGHWARPVVPVSVPAGGPEGGCRQAGRTSGNAISSTIAAITSSGTGRWVMRTSWRNRSRATDRTRVVSLAGSASPRSTALSKT